MGLFAFLKSKTCIPTLVANYAGKQYHKAKFLNIGDNPAEIAQRMSDWRYLINARLNTKMQIRFQHYFSTDFPVETILDFCLGNLDIEFLLGPPELDINVANYMGEELAKDGVPWTVNDYPAFVSKWDRLIYPLR